MSLGSLIAKARTDAGMSIDDLAAKTNMRPTVLKEIEKDNFSNCGGETYARGHVRNIAKALGANLDELIAMYEQEQGGELRSMKELLEENHVMNPPAQTSKVSWKVLVIISLVSLFVVGGVQIIISNTNTNDAVSAAPSIEATPSASEIATESPAAVASPQNTFSTGTGVEVRIDTARGKSWLFVSDAVGRTLFSGQISQGDSKVFTSDSALNLKVGNAGAVDLTVNGKKLSAIGGNGEVVSVSYGVDS